jgi:hypothetical protein
LIRIHSSGYFPSFLASASAFAFKNASVGFGSRKQGLSYLSSIIFGGLTG